MTWNLLLALVPLILALILFRPGRQQRLLWWIGVAAFVGFLPNAPYVLTDAVHLVVDVRRLQHPSALVFGLLPIYGLFFVAGFACYVAALAQLRRYLRAKDLTRLILPSETCLHVLAAVGLFLGRFDRLNSWDVLARPHAVASALYHLLAARPLVSIIAMLIVIAVATAASLTLVQSFARAVQRLRPRGALVQ
jgi:uncharacterized membrane protein